MTAIDDLPPLREAIRRHGLSARRALGQNFLLDLNLTARIARAGGPLEGVSVVEVGAGPGGLTRALLAQGAREVVAVERDPRAVAALGEIAAHYPGRLHVIPGDALRLDWNVAPSPAGASPAGGPFPLPQPKSAVDDLGHYFDLPNPGYSRVRLGWSRGQGSADWDGAVPSPAPPHPGVPVAQAPRGGPDPPPQGGREKRGALETSRIIANLPYNIGTALLVRWLGIEPWPPWYDQMILMFQREVAERLVATPGAKSYGRLAVLVSWRAEAKILFDVAPSAFVPPPKVTSSVVRLVPRSAPLACAPATLARVTAAAFGQRRKMLRQSLRPLGDPLPLLDAAGLDPAARAEDIAVEGFVALANALDASRPSRNLGSEW
jgi:16S rRNA A1518/A1519 N6-dimethyltransferase RsmA/KsgA/DIM1 with predicted DNA glycosylase/AP lyase activity